MTMRGMARGAGPGGRDRTIPRCVSTSIRGATRPWVRSRPHRLDPDAVLWRGGDDVVVTKAGKHTHGVERGFSALAGPLVRGRGVLRVSRMRVTRRTSDPVRLEPRDRQSPHPPPAGSTHTSQGQRGRPPGSQNPPRRDGPWRPERRVVQATLTPLLPWIGAPFQGRYGVGDGALGHQEARHLGRPRG